MIRVMTIVMVLMMAGVAFAVDDITSNLNAHWRLNGNSYDSSGNGLTLTPTQKPANPYPPTYDAYGSVEGSHAARVGSGADMGGFKISHADTSDLLDPVYEMSMSCWFKLDSLPALGQFITKGGGSSGNLYALYYYHGSGIKRIGIDLTNTSRNTQTCKIEGLDLRLNTWYHLAVSAKTSNDPNEDNIWLYLTQRDRDQVNLVASMEWAPSDGAGGVDRVMNYTNNGWFHLVNGESGYGFPGLIDDVRFYTRSLLPSEIQMLYDQAQTSEPDIETGLNAHWKLDGDPCDSAAAGYDIDLTPTSYASSPYPPTYDDVDMAVGTHAARVGLSGDMGGFSFSPADPDHARLQSAWQMTLSTWFWFDSLPSLAQFMTKWGGANAGAYQLYYYDADKRIALNLVNTSKKSEDLKTTDVNIDLNTWYHLAISVDSQMPVGQDNAWLYLTGEESESVQRIGSFEWNPPLADGTGEDRAMNYTNNGWFHLCNGESGYGFSGMMDDSRFYGRALSATDIQALFELAPPRTCDTAILKGYDYAEDLNKDCTVDLQDIAQIASRWLDCMDPTIGGCDRPWE